MTRWFPTNRRYCLLIRAAGVLLLLGSVPELVVAADEAQAVKAGAIVAAEAVEAIKSTPIPEQPQASPLAERDTVVVRADRVWEDLQPDILHFSGGFDMRTEKWRILADKATLFGPINDPDRIEVNGRPAKIWLLERDGSPDPLYGEGGQVEFRNAAQLLRLIGEALLIDGDNRLVSSEIEYNLDTERFNAGGSEGVEITVESAGALP